MISTSRPLLEIINMASNFQKKIAAWVKDCEDYVRSRDDAADHNFCFYSNFFLNKTAENTQAILAAASNSTTIWREDGRYLLLTHGTSLIESAPTGPAPTTEQDCDVYVSFSAKGTPSATNHPLKLAPTSALMQPAQGMTRRFSATPKADAVADTRGKVESVVNKARADSLFAATSPAVAAISGTEQVATQTSLVQAINTAQTPVQAPAAAAATPSNTQAQPVRSSGVVARNPEVTSPLTAGLLRDRGALARQATREDFRSKICFEVEGAAGQAMRAAGHKMLKKRDIAPKHRAVTNAELALHITRDSHDLITAENLADCIQQPVGRNKLIAQLAEHSKDLLEIGPCTITDPVDGSHRQRTGFYALKDNNSNDAIRVSKD